MRVKKAPIRNNAKIMMIRAFFTGLIFGFGPGDSWGQRGGIDQTFQPELLGPKVLFQLVSFRVALAKLVEKAIVDVPHIYGHDENRRKTKHNKDKTEVRHSKQIKI